MVALVKDKYKRSANTCDCFSCTASNRWSLTIGWSFPKLASLFQMLLRTAYRASFLPSLSYNVILNKLDLRPWYNRVDDRVIIGALPWLSSKDQLIEKENVRGVVSMNENFELQWLRRWVASGDHWSESNVRFLQLQTQDIFETPSQDKLRSGVDFILSTTEDLGGSVYVHCKAGRTRSATLVCCYLMRRNNWSPEQAYELLASKRPQLALHKPQWMALRQYYEDNVAKIAE